MKKITPLSRRDFIKTAGVIAGSAALAACAPSVLETPEITQPPIPTSTSKPIPPSPTSHPQFAALQDLFSQSEVFNLNNNGQVEVRVESGEDVKIKGLTVNPADGSITLEYGKDERDIDPLHNNGKILDIDPATISIDEETKTLTFNETAETGGMKWTINEKGQKIPEITNCVKTPELLPYDPDFDKLVFSPEYDAHIIAQLENGKFPEMSPEAVPFERVEVPKNQQKKLDLVGYSPAIDIPDEIAKEYRGGKKEKVPVQLGAVIKTIFNDGTPIFVFISQWIDKSGQRKLIKQIVFGKIVSFNPNELKNYMTTSFGYDSSNYIPAGRIYQKESDAGDGALNTAMAVGFKNPQMYSDWYFLNEKLLRNEDLINEWSKSGIINNMDESGDVHIPVFIYGSDSL